MLQGIPLQLPFAWKWNTYRNLIQGIGAYQPESHTGIRQITYKKIMNDMGILKDRLEY